MVNLNIKAFNKQRSGLIVKCLEIPHYAYSSRCKTFIKKYWDICSGYIFFHYTYRDGSPNVLHDIILDNVTGNPFIFDIVEPHKKRQGSITMVKKNDYV